MLVFHFLVVLAVVAQTLAASASERAAAMLAQMNATEKFAMM